ncbi:MAG: hypothetical protein OXF97_09005 [Nitrospira sp.]|nr:hypothetical protein [Nitrospira sp.]MCY3955118.1 hypothetical protein [Nitrospira sp.]MCY4131440.1 hypothetical protein [Nitrospira sp.]
MSMSHRATFTLADEAFDYLKQAGSENKSAYVNHLLLEEKRRHLKQAILRANREEAEDQAYQEELAEWDDTLADGLDS